jgi:hypothetical protein
VGRGVTRRLLFVAMMTLAIASTGLWIFGAGVGWSVGPWISPRPLVIDETVAACVNVAALAVLVVWRSTLIVILAQVANILFSVIAAVIFDPLWLLFGTAPAVVTLALAVLVRRMGPTDTGATA